MSRMKYFMMALGTFIVSMNALASPQVSITVDDLPIHDRFGTGGYTRSQIHKIILDAFESHELKGVYGFVNGGRLGDANEGREILKSWINSGQRLGNHTFTHAMLDTMSLSEYLENIAANEPILDSLSKGTDYKIFRYPYLKEGETSEKREGIRHWLFSHGYKIAQVTLDFDDYLWNEPTSRCLLKKDTRALDWLRQSYVSYAMYQIDAYRKLGATIAGREISHILLVHCGIANALFMDDLLSAIEKSWEFSELHQAMSDPIYQIDPKLVVKAGRNFLDQLAAVRHVPYPRMEEAPREKLKQICR